MIPTRFLRNTAFQLELGWIYVEPKHRGKGFSSLIVENISKHVGPTKLYATTRVDKATMQHVLTAYGFVRSGNSYPSDVHDVDIALFTRQIPE
jgi:predicted GNAT family N-acyltransferase